MGEDPEIRKIIIPYLLDELPSEERARIEDQFFDSDSFFQEMVIAEDELIESYIHGELSGDKLDRFRDQFLTSTAKRQKVETTRALLQYKDKPLNLRSALHRRFSLLSFLQRPALLPRWLVFAATLFMIFGGLAIVQMIRLSRITDDRAILEQRRQELETEAAAQSARVEQLTAELERARSQPQGMLQTANSSRENQVGSRTNQLSIVATAVLIARLVRGTNNVQVLNIPATAALLRLQVNLEPGNHKHYRATIKEDNREVFTQSDLVGHKTAGVYFITMEIALTQLSPRRNYLLTVSGLDAKGEMEDIGLTYFTFVKK